MIPFSQYIRLTFTLSFFLLIISFIFWYVSPPLRPYSAGYMLGSLVSIFNGIILAVKTVKVSEYALGRLKKMQGTGVLQRFLLAGFAGFATVKFPAYFHWLGLVLGLSSVTILSLLIAILYYVFKTDGRKG